MAERRIGLFGGSFNPIHRGHLAVAQAARERLGLERVLFIPAGDPPHKPDEGIAGGADRLRMVELAIEGRQGFEACDVELRRAGPSYTIDTVTELLPRLGPGVRLYFVIGADSLPELPKWRRIRELAALVTFVTVPRARYPIGAWEAVARAVGPEKAAEIRAHALEAPALAVSGTEVRGRVARGEPIHDLVPPAVARYIEQRGLYLPEGSSHGREGVRQGPG